MFSPISDEQVQEPIALLGVEPGGRLVDDDRAAGAPISACAMPKRWRMPPEKPASALLRTSQRLTWLQQRLDDRRGARLAAAIALEHGEVIEHVVGGDPRIDAEILRQVAERAAQRIRVARARRCRRSGSLPEVGICSVAMQRISVDLPAPFGPSNPNMPGGTSSETESSARVPFG